MVQGIELVTHELPLKIRRGTTFRPLSITWKTGPEGALLAVDLTGCTAEMHIRETETSTAVLHTLSTETDPKGITLGGVSGTVDLFISDEDTESKFILDDAVYSLEIEFPNGDRFEKLYGEIEISGEVTK